MSKPSSTFQAAWASKADLIFREAVESIRAEEAVQTKLLMAEIQKVMMLHSNRMKAHINNAKKEMKRKLTAINVQQVANGKWL